MKQLLLTAAVVLVGTSAMAQDDVNTVDQSGTLSTNIGVQNDSGNTTVVHEEGSGTTTVTNNAARGNGYVSNPNLITSGADTCFGSKSTGLSAAGIGLSGGTTVVDENCVMLKNAKLLASLGLKDAAVLLAMQTNEDIANAVFGAYPDLAVQLTAN